MIINLIDKAFAHCEYSNNPLPSLQKSKYITWNRTNIDFNDHSGTIVATEEDIKSDLFLNYKGKKIAWLLECDKINNTLYEWVKNNHDLYDVIFTHNKELLKKIKNGYWLPFGGCWINKTDWLISDKDDKISIVASNKNFLTGHKLRHQVINTFNTIETYGLGYKPIENKITSLKNYKYQIVIENEKIPGYFTEKLIDCFVTGTIPIYWGDINIGDTFNIDGIIIFNDIDELKVILNNIGNIKIDDKHIKENFDISMEYILAEDYMYKNYKDLL